MKNVAQTCLSSLVMVGALAFSGASAQATDELVVNTLAAQIRTQGFACDKAVGADQDMKRSRPDHDVWVLRCGNATYRVSRAPDMAAKVEPLK
jgi:hypothetical protein